MKTLSGWLFAWLKRKGYLPLTGLSRSAIAKIYLHGDGIEIGALHLPLPVSARARVRYVDRLSTADLRAHYPTMKDYALVPVDIVDDGETLRTLTDESVEFVIANHFLEHCENPIGAIRNMLRVVKVGGILFLSIPDKRFCFDRERALTPLEHLVRDFIDGPAWSRRAALEDYIRHVEWITNPTAIEKRIAECLATSYSIHYHVWTEMEMLELVAYLRKQLAFPIMTELVWRTDVEVILVLKKTAALVSDRIAPGPSECEALLQQRVPGSNPAGTQSASISPDAIVMQQQIVRYQNDIIQLKERITWYMTEQAKNDALLERLNQRIRSESAAKPQP